LPSPAAASFYLGKGEKKQHRGEQERGFRACLLIMHARTSPKNECPSVLTYLNFAINFM